MLRALKSGRYFSMAFRSWDLYEFPLLQRTTKHSWVIKTATQLKKPRYVIFALQAGRKNIMSEDTSRPLQIKQHEALSELGMLSVR